ncbi:MAG: 4Fe-4S dicluster domain-containing protein [Gemmatimonadetes bacterium]|nr:4Fe-4S dicluster domain-containing protein [Gemmatimonadota bacterium]
MNETRRGFLKALGLTTVGTGLGIPLLRALRPGSGTVLAQVSGPAETAPAAVPGRQWAMVVDVEKCLRDDVRAAVIEACDREHNIPRIPDPKQEVKWVWSDEYGDIFADQINAHTPAAAREAPVLVMCNHCTDPPCIRVCPTGATWKREKDGIVMMDMHRCIGCRYCMAACPFGSRSFNWRDPRPYVEHDENGKPLSDFPTRMKGVVEKCTFCAERIDEGGEPACVEALRQVPGAEGALVFGDVNDPESEVSRILSEHLVMERRPTLGTGPNVYYLVPDALPALAAAPSAGVDGNHPVSERGEVAP